MAITQQLFLQRRSTAMMVITRMILLTAVCLAIEVAMTSPAFAQEEGGEAPAPAPAAKPAQGTKVGKDGKRTTVNFEDELIEGQTQKPELFYLLQQRNNNFKRLIKLRENFLPEMRKTSEDVSRTDGRTKGSGN